MPKFDKPDSPNIIWGVNALEADLTKPADSYIQTGWTQVKPPYEYENYSMNKLYQGFAYYNQMGFPEWDSVTEYQNGKSYVQGSNNRVYKCIQTHTNKNPTTAGNEAYWELFEGNRQATTVSRGTVELATPVETAALQSDTLSVTPAGLFETILVSELNRDGGASFLTNSGGVLSNLLVKWGQKTYTGGGIQNVTFTEAFPNECFLVFLTRLDPVVTNSHYHVVSKSKTSFSFRDENTTNNDMQWLAIGH